MTPTPAWERGFQVMNERKETQFSAFLRCTVPVLLPALDKCWPQRSLAHPSFPLCRGDGRNSLQRVGARSGWCRRFSSRGCSHLKPGDGFLSDWTLKSDPCSWPCSKPVPPNQRVADHAWNAHPWSGETQSGRWSFHQLWFSRGGQWTALTLAGTDLQDGTANYRCDAGTLIQISAETNQPCRV